MPTLKEVTVSLDSNIKTVLKNIEKSGEGFCFIVDEFFKLKGVVTDGDLRRALLSGKKLNQNIKVILKKNYVKLKAADSGNNKKILNILNKKIKCIPIINNSNTLVEYVSFERFKRVSLAKPSLSGNETEYLLDCVKTGWISSTGKYVQKFKEKFEKFTKLKNCIPVSNGTVALQLAIKSLEIEKGAEIIVPNMTFASPVNAIIHSNCKPVLCDIRSDTACIDETKIESLITKKTKAIIVVHLYGHSCNMNKIKRIAKKNKLLIIEDSAEAFGTKYLNKHVGYSGDASTFSFFGNKTLTTGEGGMVSFKSKKIYNRALVLRDHGMSKNKKYWHEYVGFNFRLTNLQSAIGCAQLERANSFIRSKRRLANLYEKNLKSLDIFEFPIEKDFCRHSYWLYTLKLKKKFAKHKYKLINFLSLNGFEVRDVFFPMSKMQIYKNYKKSKSLNNSIDFSNRAFSLPSAHDVTEKDIKNIKKSITKYFIINKN